jgi:membrane protein implicated in regulation of membrane protease activity
MQLRQLDGRKLPPFTSQFISLSARQRQERTGAGETFTRVQRGKGQDRRVVSDQKETERRVKVRGRNRETWRKERDQSREIGEGVKAREKC